MKPTTFKIFSKLKIGILRKKICLCAMKMLTLGDRCLHIFCTALRKNCNDHLKRQNIPVDCDEKNLKLFASFKWRYFG